MKDDKDLITRCGKENPFKTPEGYFEHFHEQLMDSLPEIEVTTSHSTPVSLFERVKPLLYMAAMFASIIFFVQGLMYIQNEKFSGSQMAATEEIYTDEADLFMASSLYNEYTLYSYLTTYDNN